MNTCTNARIMGVSSGMHKGMSREFGGGMVARKGRRAPKWRKREETVDARLKRGRSQS